MNGDKFVSGGSSCDSKTMNLGNLMISSLSKLVFLWNHFEFFCYYFQLKKPLKVLVFRWFCAPPLTTESDLFWE